MNTFSSIAPKSRTIYLTRKDVLEDSSYRYSDVGWLSANLCFGFMHVMGIEEDSSFPYSYICRFLKGSIPVWRLDECPALRYGTEAMHHLVRFRKFLRAVRNDAAGDNPVASFVVVNMKTGDSLVVVRSETKEDLWVWANNPPLDS